MRSAARSRLLVAVLAPLVVGCAGGRSSWTAPARPVPAEPDPFAVLIVGVGNALGARYTK